MPHIFIVCNAFLQCDEATKLSKMLMEKCENALVDSEMFAHMREQVCRLSTFVFPVFYYNYTLCLH